MILEANLFSSTLFNIPRNKLIKSSIYRLILPADKDVFYLFCKKLDLTGSPEVCELRFLQNKESFFISRLVASNVIGRDGTLRSQLVFRNISEERKMETDLKESREFVQSMIDSSADCIKVIDLQGNLLSMSQGGQTLLEIDDLGLYLNRSWVNFWKAEDREAVVRAISSASNGISDSFKAFCPTAKGTPKWWDVIISPIRDSNGRISRLLALARDITMGKKAEEDLIRAKERAEESDRLKSAFLANVSHEIRTPLNAIVGFSSLLSDPDLRREERARFGDIIRERSGDLLNLIHDILDLAGIESGTVSSFKKTMVIDDLFEELEISFRQKLQKANKTALKLIAEKPSTQDRTFIVSDRAIIMKVFGHLFDNALKFTESGIIRFGYHFPSENILSCYVSDTGIGIEKDSLESIFEHFRKGSVKRTDKLYGGTGLGLSICKGALDLLHGRIGVESVSGQGSTFWFTIPMNEETVALQPRTELTAAFPGHITSHPRGKGQPDIKNTRTRKMNRSEAEPWETKPETDLPDWTGSKFLVVEDEESNLELFKLILEPTGVEIVTAETGKEVRDLFSVLDTFNLVLLDIRLPDADGRELAREIKTLRPDLPVIAQSAHALENDRRKSLQAGCAEHLTKPINRSEWFRVIGNYLSREKPNPKAR